jgi:hypothetical protein
VFVIYQKVQNLHSSLTMRYYKDRRNRLKSLACAIKSFKHLVKISSQIINQLINIIKISKAPFRLTMSSRIHSIKIITQLRKLLCNMRISGCIISISVDKKHNSFIIFVFYFIFTWPFVILNAQKL